MWEQIFADAGEDEPSPSPPSGHWLRRHIELGDAENNTNDSYGQSFILESYERAEQIERIQNHITYTNSL